MELKSLLDLKADLWVFDCDGVFYDNVKGAEKEVVGLMLKFIASRYGCCIGKASEIRRGLLKKHQVPHSIMALVREGFNEQEVLKETYFLVDFQKLGIISSSRMQRLFSSLPGKKIILTNNHGEYTWRVLDCIGIANHFSAVYGISQLGLIQKPDRQAFQFVQDTAGVSGNVVFVDDEIPNVIAAEQFGWTSVWKGNGNGYDGLWLPKLW